MNARISVVCLALLTASAPGATAQDLDQMLSQSHEVVAQAAEGSGTLGQALQVAQASVGAAATLPNGASSITETFGDWTVNCAIQSEQKMCAASQAQGNNQTGQQVFAIELYAAQQGASNGVLILPFGLDIQQPVALAIDEQALESTAEFTTCVPGGCVVPIAFPQSQLDALKSGTTLTVTAKSASTSGDPAQFAVSLAGFTAAIDRINQLVL